MRGGDTIVGAFALDAYFLRNFNSYFCGDRTAPMYRGEIGAIDIGYVVGHPQVRRTGDGKSNDGQQLEAQVRRRDREQQQQTKTDRQSQSQPPQVP